MDTAAAALETILFSQVSSRVNRFPKTGTCAIYHLNNMQEKMVSEDFPDDKANRYLGYIQGVCVFSNALTVEQCKQINKKWL